MVPRECTTRRLAQLVNERLQLDDVAKRHDKRRADVKRSKQQLKAEREAAAWHMCLVDFFGRPGRRVLCASPQKKGKRGRKANLS
jgi:hypothetical protein